jgi:hypothetical protein
MLRVILPGLRRLRSVATPLLVQPFTASGRLRIRGRFKGARRIAVYAFARFFGFLAFLTAPGKVLNTPPPLEETPLPVPPNENAVPKLYQNAVFHLLWLERSADSPNY